MSGLANIVKTPTLRRWRLFLSLVIVALGYGGAANALLIKDYAVDPQSSGNGMWGAQPARSIATSVPIFSSTSRSTPHP